MISWLRIQKDSLGQHPDGDIFEYFRRSIGFKKCDPCIDIPNDSQRTHGLLHGDTAGQLLQYCNVHRPITRQTKTQKRMAETVTHSCLIVRTCLSERSDHRGSFPERVREPLVDCKLKLVEIPSQAERSPSLSSSLRDEIVGQIRLKGFVGR